MKVELAKGVRDISGKEKIVRDKIVKAITLVFERYGFNPLETPIIERYETFLAKYGAGEDSDVLKETYKFEDQGKRKLALRFDLTVPFARFIAMNSRMKMPFKRYEIGNAFRDGPIKLGRYRQFAQCDGDIVGVKSMKADAECIQLAFDGLDLLELDSKIVFNNRKLLNGLLTQFGVKNTSSALIVIDKINKLSNTEFAQEMEKVGITVEQLRKINDAFGIQGSNQDKLLKLYAIVDNDEARDGLKEIEEILNYIPEANLEFDQSLVRGQGYYTGTIFEGFAKNSKVTSSICGGGRYDKMIGGFLGQDMAAVGISYGLDTIQDVLMEKGTEEKSVVKLYVIPIKQFPEGFKLVKKLRDAGINCDIDLKDKGISKNLDFANAYSIPYVLFIGETELESGKFKLKDMKTGSEEMLSLDDVISKLV